jgi:hypothetical protein
VRDDLARTRQLFLSILSETIYLPDCGFFIMTAELRLVRYVPMYGREQNTFGSYSATMTSKQIISIFSVAGLLASAGMVWSSREREAVDETVQAALQSMKRRSLPPIGREFPTSTPGVSYIRLSNGDVEFHAPPGFRGVAVTPDNRSLYLAN